MTDACHAFLSGLDPVPAALELGTARSEVSRPTHHMAWAPSGRWTLFDITTQGGDVDVVGDAHALPFAPASFDAYVACSVYEHLARPWNAAVEAARVLKPGGLAYVQTHQTFPIHGYPSDFWRFTTEALSLIFADAGMEVVSVGYEYPCEIRPPAVQFDRGWNAGAPSYLNVDLCARAA